MDMKQEVMDDAVDDALGDDDEEEETCVVARIDQQLTRGSEQIVNSVLDELGVGIGQEMASVPAGKTAGKQTESAGADADLQVPHARLPRLTHPLPVHRRASTRCARPSRRRCRFGRIMRRRVNSGSVRNMCAAAVGNAAVASGYECGLSCARIAVA